MLTRLRILLLSLTVAFVPLSIVAPSDAVAVGYTEGTDAAAAFFDPLKVTRIDLVAPQASIDGMNNDGGHSIYQPATIKITMGSKVLGPFDVGVHLKGGWGSTRWLDGKAGFKVNVNYGSKPDQTILGLKKITLNNMVQDPSMLHEAVAYRLFRSVGVPAPRVGYANVFLNGQSYGLHANIETMDKVSLKRWFNSTRHLYEGSYFPDVTPDNRAFSVDSGSKTKLDDLDRLISINQLNGAAWYKEMSTWTNLKELTMMWATELYVGHWDGYAHNRNNYYLHSDDTNKFSMLPWGTDQTFGWDVDLLNYGGNGIMFQKCMSYTPCRSLYVNAVLTVWNKAQVLELPTMVDRISAAIESAMVADPRKEYGADSVHQTQASTKDFLAARNAYGINAAASIALVKPTLKASLSKKAITLTWAGLKVTGVTQVKYVLERSTNNSAWTVIANTLTTTTKFTSVPNGTYYYRVSLVTSVGTTPYSSTVTVRVT